jgi:hypothetical protein
MSKYENANIMNEEAKDAIIDVVEMAAAGPETGVPKAVKIVCGVVAAVATVAISAVFGTKAWKEHKSKTEVRKPDEDTVVELSHEDIVELSE